jgi:polyisoprenyl-phosphate glycosyltransferase
MAGFRQLPRKIPLLSIVIPFYNEVESLPEFGNTLRVTLDALNESYEVIFVDDGSTDGTVKALRESSWPQASVIRLIRNFGHQSALLAGLEVARGEYIVTMDADGQHPQEMIPSMLSSARKEHLALIHMVRNRRTHLNFLKNITSMLFYRVAQVSTNTNIANGQADFRLIRKDIRDLLLATRGPQVIRVTLASMNVPSKTFTYEERQRLRGKSKYTFRKMVKLAGSFAFDSSTLPLRFTTQLAWITSTLASIWTLSVLAAWITGNSVPGWASIMVAVLACMSILTFLIAVQSAYLARLYDAILHRESPKIFEQIHLG